MSLNESITKELKERIENLPDGARFATESELCREFGVSRMPDKYTFGPDLQKKSLPGSTS